MKLGYFGVFYPCSLSIFQLCPEFSELRQYHGPIDVCIFDSSSEVQEWLEASKLFRKKRNLTGNTIHIRQLQRLHTCNAILWLSTELNMNISGIQIAIRSQHHCHLANAAETLTIEICERPEFRFFRFRPKKFEFISVKLWFNIDKTQETVSELRRLGCPASHGLGIGDWIPEN